MPTINATPAPRTATRPSAPAAAPANVQVDSFTPSVPGQTGPVYANGLVSGFMSGNVSGYVPGMLNGTVSGTITGTLMGSDGRSYPFNGYINVPISAMANAAPRAAQAPPQSAFRPDPK
ncbi:MAG: hypothetical protein ACYCW6_27100 [Candidatus Xenobia bacterium]